LVQNGPLFVQKFRKKEGYPLTLNTPLVDTQNQSIYLQCESATLLVEMREVHCIANYRQPSRHRPMRADENQFSQ